MSAERRTARSRTAVEERPIADMQGDVVERAVCRVALDIIDASLNEALERTSEVLTEEFGCVVEAHAAFGAGAPTSLPNGADAARGPAATVNDQGGQPIATLRLAGDHVRSNSTHVRSQLSAATEGLSRLLTHARDDEQLKQREKMFRDTVESAAEAIVGIAASGTICFVNRAATHVFRSSAEDLLGKPATQMLPPPMSRLKPRLIPALIRRQARLAGGRPILFTARRRDGSTVSLELTLATREEDDDCRCIASMRDVSEHVEADAARERALRLEQRGTRRLRAVSEMRRDLVAAVYHELVEPLSVISGLSGLLAADDEWPPDEQRFRPMLEHMHRAGDQMSRVVGDLLTLDRFEHDELPIRLEDVDLRSVIDQVVSEPAFMAASIRVEGEDESVRGDPALIRTVMRNLLTNAIRHSPPGGDVEVAIWRGARGAVIGVTDFGPGIAKRDRRKVFTPFWRGNQTDEGLGLGLAIVQAFVRAHGGRVWIEDTPEGGSTFKVLLPRRAR
jgi:PAS domain S-box-containing protein